MRTLLAALTALMLFATPVVAGDYQDGWAASKAGDFQKAFRLLKPFAEQGHARAQTVLGLIYAPSPFWAGHELMKTISIPCLRRTPGGHRRKEG